MKRRRTRRWIANALLLIGVAALDVRIWSNAVTPFYQGWETWAFDREIRGTPAPISEYMAERAGQLIAHVKSWLGLSPIPRPPEPVARRDAPPPPPPPRPHKIEPNGLVGRLSIPRLHLSAMVREGTGEDTLMLALGHIPSTALPGEKGNVAVAGHRDRLFRGLRAIREKDVILFETLEGNYSYRVESTEIVKPEDVSVLKAGPDPELTLVTCYPFYYVGSAPNRFIVKARQVTPAKGTKIRVGSVTQRKEG